MRATMPLAAVGSVVRDLELRFQGGKVVDVSASSGAGLVRSQLEADPQAAYLGEVALVDGSSAVGKTGLVFQNTLFDENATCHIAYGTGLPMAVDGTDGLSTDELLALGVNISQRAHRLHDRRPGGGRRRPRSRRRRHADPARRRLGALSLGPIG